ARTGRSARGGEAIERRHLCGRVLRRAPVGVARRSGDCDGRSTPSDQVQHGTDGYAAADPERVPQPVHPCVHAVKCRARRVSHAGRARETSRPYSPVASGLHRRRTGIAMIRRLAAAGCAVVVLMGFDSASYAGEITPRTAQLLQSWARAAQIHVPGRGDEAVATIERLTYQDRVEMNAGLELFLFALEARGVSVPRGNKA